MALTDKQRAFVIEYVKDYNAKQAAIRAGYAKASAHTSGWNNINNYEVLEAIEAFHEDNAMSAKEVLSRLTMAARGLLAGSDVHSQLRALDLLAKHHQLTTTTQVKTWRDEAVESIKRGEIDYDAFVEMFEDESLAKQLFMQAGVPVED